MSIEIKEVLTKDKVEDESIRIDEDCDIVTDEDLTEEDKGFEEKNQPR